MNQGIREWLRWLVAAEDDTTQSGLANARQRLLGIEQRWIGNGQTKTFCTQSYMHMFTKTIGCLSMCPSIIVADLAGELPLASLRDEWSCNKWT